MAGHNFSLKLEMRMWDDIYYTLVTRREFYGTFYNT